MSAVTVDNEFRLGLQRVLARLQDKESFPIVQADLGDPDPHIRAGAIRLIGELALKDFLPNIRERLQKLYGKDQPPGELEFTIAVFNALEKIGDPEISEELARRFEQIPDKLKSPSLGVIAAHGAESKVVDGFFQGLLRPDTPYPKLRSRAAELYASMAPNHFDPKSVVGTLRKFLNDPEPAVALASADAMTRLLGDRVFELPEWKDISIEVRSHVLQFAPSVPSAALEEALKSDALALNRAGVQRVLSASVPPEAVRDVIRLYSTDETEEKVVADRLAASLGRWYASGQGRLVLMQTFSYILRRHAGVLEKFLPAPGTIMGDMDRVLARLRRAMLRCGSEKISETLLQALSGKGAAGEVMAAVDEQIKVHPKEKELQPAVAEMLAITDDRIRKRIVTEVRVIPAGAFIPIKKILKILPPMREPSLISSLRLLHNLAKIHADEELEWVSTMHLAGCGDSASLTAVCDAVLKGVSGRASSAAPETARRPADVSIWVRSLSTDTANARVRATLLAIIQRSTQPETFRAAVELLTAKVDAEVSNILMHRLPSLKGALRFIVIQAIGRMGDRVHLPVFLSEIRAPEEDRRLAGLLGLEKLLDANPALPPDTVSAPLYELKNHKSAFVRASAIGLLVRLQDPNRVELVSGLIASPGAIPLGSYRLVDDLVDQQVGEDDLRSLFQSLLARIGRMAEEEEAVCAAFRKILGENPFSTFLQPRRQRAEAVEDLKDLLRKRSASQASTDFKISKSIQRRAIGFLDITGFTPRAARMTAIELGVFLVQVEDEILPFIQKHSGILVKRLGDGFLLSFPGSIHAVAACLEVLHFLAKKNQLMQEDDRVRLRAGIHVGDVLVDRDDVFGDTVNMAARVEAQAKPMCICLTEDVYGELPKRTDAIECMGPTKLKGKEDPVTLYLIRLDVIYEAQTEAIQKLMATPDWLPKIQKFESRLEEQYQRIKGKIDEARQMVEHGDYAHAETLVEEIERMML